MYKFELFHGQRVIFSNKSNYNQVITKIAEQGPSRMTVITDFDFTLTKFRVYANGPRAASCHGVIEKCGLISEDYQQRATVVQNKYYPLEVDPDIDIQKKIEYMIEWVRKTNELLIEYQVTGKIIKQAVEKCVGEKEIIVRNKVKDFFENLSTHQIPSLIFSAGIAEILEGVLSLQFDMNKLLIDVISNRGIYDESGRLVGFEEPVLHVFNKNCRAFLNTPYFNRSDFENRKNLILIGDSLTDLHMMEGMPHNLEAVLKIGFLNDRPERLAQYLELFDLVIMDDPEDFEIPLQILNSILQPNPKLIGDDSLSPATSSDALSLQTVLTGKPNEE